jgi:hypothetical protein
MNDQQQFPDGPDEALAPLVAQLPRSIEPPHDLWPAIAAQIAPARRVTWQGWQLAAALLLVVVSSFITWSLTRRQVAAPPAVASADLEAIESYARASDEMSSALADPSSAFAALSPGTRAILERNLAVIDSVIAECRAAVAADSANPSLRELLGGAERQRLDLLRQAARLPRS